MNLFSRAQDWSTSEREIPLHTLEGVPDADIHVHPFTTQDGLGLSLHRFLRAPCDDVVLILHGLTASSDLFIMPEHENLVRYLLDHGFTDVWTLDSRMSNRYPYTSRYPSTLDDLAAFDYPAAVARLRQVVGERRLHVICHCLGSVSFLMSLAGGVVDDVASVIAHSVALTPRVPRWSQVKLAVAPFLLEQVLDLPHLDPNASQAPLLSRSGMLGRVVDLLHRECDEPACHMLSMMWGSGSPALHRHENLHEVTHRRMGDLYGPTGFHYYRHVWKMVRAGRAVKYDLGDPRLDHLPDDYLSRAREIEAPILLVTGSDNRVFADSNIVCYQRLEALAPGRHSLEVIPGYCHQDLFVGKHSARDVFPRFLRHLEAQRHGRQVSRVAAV